MAPRARPLSAPPSRRPLSASPWSSHPGKPRVSTQNHAKPCHSDPSLIRALEQCLDQNSGTLSAGSPNPRELRAAAADSQRSRVVPEAKSVGLGQSAISSPDWRPASWSKLMTLLARLGRRGAKGLLATSHQLLAAAARSSWSMNLVWGRGATAQYARSPQSCMP